MHFSFNFLNLSKVFAVRSRKNRQNDLATTFGDSGDSVPVSHPPALPSDSATTYAVSARIERRVSVFTPEVSDKVQLALGGAQSVVGPIPLVGDPLRAAVNGVLTILQTIDRRAQNKALIACLRRRLHRLCRYLCNAPAARDGFEQSLRDDLISLLQDTSDQLTELDNGGLGYQSVTQALAGFSTELDHCLVEYAFAAHMNTKDCVIGIETHLRQFRGSTAMDLPRTFTYSIILVDATGYEHRIPEEFCTSFEQLKNMLYVLFTPDTDTACIQRRYLEEGKYDLCIDQGTQITELTSETDGWSAIEPGTKVVMRIITRKNVYSNTAVNCDGCGYSNFIVQSAGVTRGDCWTIYCRECNRRYQISNPSQIYNGGDPTTKVTKPTMMHLIRNIHVQETLLSQSEREEFRSELFFFRELELSFEDLRKRQRRQRRELFQSLSLQPAKHSSCSCVCHC